MDRHHYLAVVNLIFLRNKEVLLARRFQTGYMDGSYELPSGHLDGKETVQEAAAREAFEETGVSVETKDLHVHHVLHRYGDPHERIEFFLVATHWEGEPKIAEPEKCDDLRWFPIYALPENMIPKSKYGLEKALAGELYSEFGWEER